MPGMEVFTISGSNLRASAAPPVLLQNALKALGAAHGDSALNITVDGIIGPNTVKAVNYALKTYVGAGPAQAAGLSGRFLNATPTKSDVQQYADTLAQIVTQSVQSAGGTVPPPVVTHSSGGGGKSSLLPMAPAPVDNTMNNPNLVWVLGGGAPHRSRAWFHGGEEESGGMSANDFDDETTPTAVLHAVKISENRELAMAVADLVARSARPHGWLAHALRGSLRSRARRTEDVGHQAHRSV